VNGRRCRFSSGSWTGWDEVWPIFVRLIANLELRMGTLQETERNVREGEFSSPTPYVISKI
jgi:hypothetical protein